MGLIKRIEQTNNLYQTWVEITSSHAEVLWLDHEMTEAEAIILWPSIKAWRERTGEAPNIQSFDPKEKRMAEAIIYLRELKRQRALNEQ